MSLKLKKYGILIIAAVLLVAVAFAGAASADATNTSITSWAELEQNITVWNSVGGSEMLTIILSNDLTNTTGSYYDGLIVTSNVTIKPSSDVINDEVILDEQGHGRLFQVNANGNLTIRENGTKTLNLTGGSHTFGNGAGIVIGGGTFNMYSGNITNCTACDGGGVYFYDGTFNMYGGNITGCSADNGGGVCLVVGTFNMYGGNITGCSADNGGGVCLNGLGEVNIYDSKITGNTASIGAEVFIPVSITLSGNAKIGENSIALLTAYVTPNITVSNGFSGGVGNITLYDMDSEPRENASAWVGKVVINGSTDTTKFKLSTAPMYRGYQLKANGNDLILAGPESYDIYITNATGTFLLTSALMKVCGDYGTADNGTAFLIFDSESKPVLTLNGFKASNTSGNVPIINSSVADLTIKLTGGESNLTGSYDNSNGGLILSYGNLTIERYDGYSNLLVNNTKSGSSGVISIWAAKNFMIDNARVTAIANNSGTGIANVLYGRLNTIITGSNTVVDAHAASAECFAYSIMAGHDILIDSSAKVTASADTQGSTSSNTAHGLYVISGNIMVSDSAKVTAVANSSNGKAYAISDLYLNGGITIDNANVTATANGKNETFAIVSNVDTILITGASVVNAHAASSAGNASAIITHLKDIIIESGALVTANASASQNAFAINSEKSNVSITDANTVVRANATSSYNAISIIAEGKLAIDAGADISAVAHNTGSGATVSLSGTNIGIAGAETVVFAEAESNSLSAIAIFGNNVTVTSVRKLTAMGSGDPYYPSSFGYNVSGTGSLDMTGLAGYAFSNATVSGAEPKTYAAFSNNWHTYGPSRISNYTAVTIEKVDTPSPTYTSSSSKHSGSTVILSEGQVAPTAYATAAPTVSPTVKPTEQPATPTAVATEKPTTTPKTPAPFVGLLAGLGAAALFLGRLRR